MAGSVSWLVILVALSATLAGPANAQAPGGTMMISFDDMVVGSTLAGFTIAKTGGGESASWQVRDDPTSPSGRRAVVQTSDDYVNMRFPLLVLDRVVATDVDVSVKFKPWQGKIDQAAGLVVRYLNADNYYVVRANALENNVRLYRLVNGVRIHFAGRDEIAVHSGEWQKLGLKVSGRDFEVRLNDTLLFRASDTTFASAGKVGLWTKADSVTYFDDLTVTVLR